MIQKRSEIQSEGAGHWASQSAALLVKDHATKSLPFVDGKAIGTVRSET